MNLASLNRSKAALIHLGISAAIGAAVITLMLFVWYPRPYFTAMGGETLMLLLVGVDVVIGPLITLVVFDPAKKNLRFDLAVIALLQVAALAYGCQVMFNSRPVYNIFVVDRFEVVAANRIDEVSLATVTQGEFASLPLTGPKIVAARQPDDPKRRTDILFQSMNGGHDLADLPELYVPYSEARADAAKTARPLQELIRRQPGDAATIRALASSAGRTEETVGYLPMKARNRDMTVLLDRKSGDVIGILPVYPW
ncbi:MAG: TfpX/TfpZ family type IV pilin accessory protein [Betaproteobacteria bacterium]